MAKKAADHFRWQLLANIPSLRRYARTLTGNSYDADDLVQMTLLRAMEKWQSWRQGTNLRAWLLTIQRNLFISGKRREKHTIYVSDVTEPKPNLKEPVKAEMHVMLQEMEAAIDRLSDEHKSVLLLTAVEELSYEEAADVAGIPIGTIRSRLSRARAEIRLTYAESHPRPVSYHGG